MRVMHRASFAASRLRVKRSSRSSSHAKPRSTRIGHELVQIRTNSDPTADDTCDTRYWVCQDANYNVLGVIDAISKLVERYEYTPYGERTVFFSPGANDPDLMAPTLMSRRIPFAGGVNQPYGLNEFGHQGLHHDEELGLVYNRARSLHPTLGRFMQRDPLGYVDGMGLYEYVRSGPVARRDPSGLASVDWVLKAVQGEFAVSAMLDGHAVARVGNLEIELRIEGAALSVRQPINVPEQRGGSRGKKLCATLRCNRVNGSASIQDFHGQLGIRSESLDQVLQEKYPAVSILSAQAVVVGLVGEGAFESGGFTARFWDFGTPDAQAIVEEARDEMVKSIELALKSPAFLRALGTTGLIFPPGSGLSISATATFSECKLYVEDFTIRLF